MTKTIDGVKYLMRDQSSIKKLRRIYREFCAKYGRMDFHKWLVERGKVYKRVSMTQRAVGVENTSIVMRDSVPSPSNVIPKESEYEKEICFVL